jgi:hypothetical protein
MVALKATPVPASAAVHSPILMATSVEANSGKTTLLDLVRYPVSRVEGSRWP